MAKRDREVPEGFPWDSFEEFERDMEVVLDEMKRIGVAKGILEVTPEGYLKGRGHPDKWFDAVDEET